MSHKRKRIIVFQLGWVGDSVMTIPAMLCLRRAYPEARLVRVVNAKMEDFFQGCPLADEVISFDREGVKTREGARLLARLKKDRPTHFFNLHTPDFDRPFRHYFRDNLFALLTGAPVRASYAHSVDSIFLTHPVPRNLFGESRMDREMLKVVESVTSRVDLDYSDVDFWVSAEDAERASRILEEAGVGRGEPYFAVSPFAKRESKEWSYEKWREVLREVHEVTALPALLLGGPRDRKKDKSPFEACRFLKDLTGKTGIKEAASILGRARFVLAVDSGIMHIAALMGTPLVALFGPGNAVRWHPIDERGKVVIVREDVECAPCFLDRCDDMRCLESVHPERVVRAALSLVEG